MNVYDFDKTIYDGDSTVRFWLYCLRTRPRTLRALPSAAWAGALFALRIISKTSFKQRFYRFLAYLDDRETALEEFWAREERRVKHWYLETRRDDDLIISASPEFLLAPVCARLGAALIASRVDADTGEYDGVNCSGAEKPRRFREEYGEAAVERFCSDSRGDAPMAALAKRAFLVRGDKLSEW